MKENRPSERLKYISSGTLYDFRSQFGIYPANILMNLEERRARRLVVVPQLLPHFHDRDTKQVLTPSISILLCILRAIPNTPYPVVRGRLRFISKLTLGSEVRSRSLPQRVLDLPSPIISSASPGSPSLS